MSDTIHPLVTNPLPPVAPMNQLHPQANPQENWLAMLGDAGPAARLLSVLERLETSQANLTAADGGKAGLIRKNPSPFAGEPANAAAHTELTALRQENQALRATQQQAADRLATLIPSLAAHLHEEATATTALAELTLPLHEAAA